MMRFARAIGLAATAALAYALLKKATTRAASLVLQDVVITLPSPAPSPAPVVRITRNLQTEELPRGTVIERIQAAGSVRVLGWGSTTTAAFEVLRLPEGVRLPDGRTVEPPTVAMSTLTVWLRMPDGSRKVLVLSQHGEAVEVDLRRPSMLYSGPVRRLWAVVGASADRGTDVLDLTDADVAIHIDEGLLRIEH